MKMTIRHSGSRIGVTSYTAGDLVSYQPECPKDREPSTDEFPELVELEDLQAKPEVDPKLEAAADKDLKKRGVSTAPRKKTT